MKKIIFMLCAFAATTLATAQSYPHEPDPHVTKIERYQKPAPAPAPESATTVTPSQNNSGQPQTSGAAQVAKKEEPAQLGNRNTAVAETEN